MQRCEKTTIDNQRLAVSGVEGGFLGVLEGWDGVRAAFSGYSAHSRVGLSGRVIDPRLVHGGPIGQKLHI